MYALVDCNNFYVSCEQVFNPRVRDKPVVILSNNDGCVIARSAEAKALGIAMGVPAFKIRRFIDTRNVAVFSSNYALYADMSQRVMDTLTLFTPELEIYSIDEAFLDLSHFTHRDLPAYAQDIQKAVKQWTGLPVSVGIAPTKTLAKAANHFAKREASLRGVLVFPNEALPSNYLTRLKVKNIWGIGNAYARFLEGHRIRTAHDLTLAKNTWIKKHLTITGLRTTQELRGIPCIAFDNMPTPKKGIMVSRAFSQSITTLFAMKQAVATYTTRAAEKLRHEKRTAKTLTVFLRTNPFTNDAPYTNFSTIELAVSTSNTSELIQAATDGVEKIFRSGYRYKKCGVLLDDLSDEFETQLDLFSRPSTPKKQCLMKVLDQINQSMGRNMLRYAALGICPKWETRFRFFSHRYTTRWDELPLATAR
ncbi:Y-family DNA polymerase [PVC group bacterium]|nr:Y-family DNA polymerase [PVC group bacterium]